MKDPRDGTAWKEFAVWCQTSRLRALPAHPWTLAAFLRWRGAQPRRGNLNRFLNAVARAHLAQAMQPPDQDPIVQRTLRAVEAEPKPRFAASALFQPGDFTKLDDTAAKPDGKKTAGFSLSSKPRLRKRRNST